MRSRVLASWCLLAILGGLLIGCGPKTKPADKAPGAAEPPGPVDTGSPLYPAVAPPVYTATTGRDESLVIPNCVVQYEERQIVSAEVDGTIVLFMVSAGTTVDARQVVALMDDQLVRVRFEGSKKINQSAKEAKVNAARGAEAAKDRYDIEVRLVGGNTKAKTVIDELITLSRFLENVDQANQTIAKTEAEYQEAEVLIGRHQIKTGNKMSGTIRTIARRPGEYVKAGEKIMEIEGTDKVRIEGQVGVEHYAKLLEYKQKEKDVIVEPALPSAATASHTGHRQAVTGVAVTYTSPPREQVMIPLVVSVGADGAALVWEPNLRNEANRPAKPHSLPHPIGVGVRCVAATPVASKATLVVTGADDGKVRIWDVSNRDKLPATPKAEPEDSHASAVQAIAISPDGKFFATAAGRDVFVWDTTAAKKKYALSLDHRDSVTSVSFTPQNTLITASKDGTIKVWKLGDERAAVIRTLDHRSGAIDVLGVSRDGARLLFDQDKTRIDLVDPASGQTVGQIQNAGSAGSFSSLAVFGPDEDAKSPYTIATAGGDGDLKGVLQLWHASRTGGRGTEVGRLVTDARAPVTTAAFSPVLVDAFLVVGTSAGSVHLWKTPTESPKTHKGRITYIDATDTKYVTVRVEMNNKQLGLLDHSVANVIIPSEK